MVSSVQRAQPASQALPLHTTDDFDPPGLPSSDHLVITTPQCVYSWDAHGVAQVFKSGSGGIVAAKRAKDGSGKLAIADSQVVVLHDVKKGQQRSYKLKGAEGQVRLLRYANDSKSLFFTTTLQNSVQSYSLRQARLTEPLHVHPSPPTCIALSPTSHMLVSCSAKPPSIHVQNLTLQTPPLILRPAVSEAQVLAANFHTERPSVFLLAFHDGVIALYDATRLYGTGATAPKKGGAPGPGHGGEVGYVKNMHMSQSPHDTFEAGSATSGITAAEFLPSYKARVVTAGLDGRCNLVDFENLDQRKGRVVKTWHVRAPVTSLAILSFEHDIQPHQLDGSSHLDPTRFKSNLPKPKQPSKETLIAAGRIDGKVLMFDTTGHQVGEKTFDPEGNRIIDVEWVKGPGDASVSSTLKPEAARDRRKGNKSSIANSVSSKRSALNIDKEFAASQRRAAATQQKRKSLSSILGASRPVEEEVVAVDNIPAQPPLPKRPDLSVTTGTLTQSYTTAPHSPTNPHHEAAWQDVAPTTATYLSLFSPMKSPSATTTTSSINPPALPHRVTSKAHSHPSPAPNITATRPTGTAREIQLLLSSADHRASAVSAPQIWAAPVVSTTRNRPIHTGRRVSKGKAGGSLLLFAPYMPATTTVQPASPHENDTHDAPQEADDIWLSHSRRSPAHIPVRKSSRGSCKTSISTDLAAVAESSKASRKSVSSSEKPAGGCSCACHGEELRLREEMEAIRRVLEDEMNGLREEMGRRFDAQESVLTRLLLQERQRERRAGR